MVNASLNWASIVGIVLAVGGTMLYFLRSFKPGLARDYDVFFAAVGLLCGGILFSGLAPRSNPAIWSVFISGHNGIFCLRICAFAQCYH